MILVAHSMGGLVARCMMHKIAVKRGRPAKDLVAKLFTYGTPHGGIAFQSGLLNWFEDVIGPAGSDIFAPQNMYGYLTPGKKYGEEPKEGENWDPQSMPPDVFDTDDIFCLIGTDSKDNRLSRKVVGPKSDGLVRIERADVRKAHRAFVFKSHSGTYGEVNAEEGYQNLRRFLFGRWKVRVDRWPPTVPGEPKSGERHLAGGHASVGARVVGGPQRATGRPVQPYPTQCGTRTTPGQPGPSGAAAHHLPDGLHDSDRANPNHGAEAAARHHGRARYSLTLRVAKLKEDDHFFDFSDHLEQVFEWADSVIVDVGPDDSQTGLYAWAKWNSEVKGAIEDFDPIAGQPCPITNVSDGQMQFDLPLPAPAKSLEILGTDSKLRFTITDRMTTSGTSAQLARQQTLPL